VNCLTFEDEIDGVSRNVGDYLATLCKIPKERRSHLRCGKGLKSRLCLIYIQYLSVYESN